MVATCPIAAGAAISFSSEIDADGDGVCRDWILGDCAWGRDCGGFIWASADGTRSSALAVSVTAANGRTRRIRAVLRSVYCISFLRFPVPGKPGRLLVKLMADWAFNIRQIGRYPVTKMTHRRPL